MVLPWAGLGPHRYDDCIGGIPWIKEYEGDITTYHHIGCFDTSVYGDVLKPHR